MIIRNIGVDKTSILTFIILININTLKLYFYNIQIYHG